MSSETVIVVPCFNEAARLDLAAFAAFLEYTESVSLLMVDDGSTDGTPLVLERLRLRHPQRVSVLRLGTNAGKAEAVRRGVRLALRHAPAMVGYWDADLATPLEATLGFRDLLMARPELSLVMGSRVALLGRQIRRSWKRHVLGRVFATLTSWVLGLPVYDTQCGAKLFRVTPQVANLFRRPFRTRWVFDVEILARLAASGARDTTYEFPLECWQDVAGSRLRPSDFLVAGWDLAAIYWCYSPRWSRLSDVPVQHPALAEDTIRPLSQRDAA